MSVRFVTSGTDKYLHLTNGETRRFFDALGLPSDGPLCGKIARGSAEPRIQSIVGNGWKSTPKIDWSTDGEIGDIKDAAWRLRWLLRWSQKKRQSVTYR